MVKTGIAAIKVQIAAIKVQIAAIKVQIASQSALAKTCSVILERKAHWAVRLFAMTMKNNNHLHLGHAKGFNAKSPRAQR